MAGSALREIFAKFGIDFDAGPLSQGSAAVDGLVGQIQGLGQIVAGAAIVHGIRAFAADMTRLGDEIGDTSAMLGISGQELQEWRHVAGLSGVEAGEFTAALIRLQNRMAQGGEGAAIFRRLGVEIRGADGELRNASDVLTDLADPIAALSTDAERTGVLMDLLGRSGARLGPLFSRGSEGIAEARAELALLGGGMSEEAIQAASDLEDANRRLDVSWLSLRSRVAVILLPALERFTAWLTDASGAFNRVAERGRILETILAALGATAAAAGARTAVAWAAAAAPFVGLAVVVGAAILVFEDLWVGLEGGESLIGEVAVAFDDWGQRTTGVVNGVITVWEVLKGVILSTIQLAGEAFGLDLLSGGTGDVATRQPGASAEDDLANQIVARRRADLPVDEAFVPDSLERFLAIREARDQIAGGVGVAGPLIPGPSVPPTVTQTVRIDRIDASGLTPDQATRVVETAVQRALSAQADETLDALDQGGGSGA